MTTKVKQNIVTVSVALNGHEVFRNYGFMNNDPIENNWQKEVDSMLGNLQDVEL